MCNADQCGHTAFNNGVCLGCGHSEVALLHARVATLEAEARLGTARSMLCEDSLAMMTRVVREADETFKRTGGSTRDWVAECFRPALDRAGLRVVGAVLDDDYRKKYAELEEEIARIAPPRTPDSCTHEECPAVNLRSIEEALEVLATERIRLSEALTAREHLERLQDAVEPLLSAALHYERELAVQSEDEGHAFNALGLAALAYAKEAVRLARNAPRLTFDRMDVVRR